MLNETPQAAPDGQPFRLSVLRNRRGMVVTVMDWGATLLSARVPMADGSVRETLLGCPSPQHYLQQSAYLGASIGRYANRIAQASIKRGSTSIRLSANQNNHHLHGGGLGFDKRRWLIERQNEQEVIYRLHSADGDQGFPGNLQVRAHYALSEDNRLTLTYQAQVDQPCPVSISNHAYFNLDPQPSDIRQHRLQINADYYLPVDNEGIPSAGLKDVAGTSFDFRQPKRIGAEFYADDDQRAMKGYDHAFLLRTQGQAEMPAARLWSGDEQLLLTVFTTAPALHCYTGNYLAGVPAREQGTYRDYQGLALESEFLPDSPNHPEWPQPSCWLQPGETYSNLTVYQFQPAKAPIRRK